MSRQGGGRDTGGANPCSRVPQRLYMGDPASVYCLEESEAGRTPVLDRGCIRLSVHEVEGRKGAWRRDDVCAAVFTLRWCRLKELLDIAVTFPRGTRATTDPTSSSFHRLPSCVRLPSRVNPAASLRRGTALRTAVCSGLALHVYHPRCVALPSARLTLVQNNQLRAHVMHA